MRVGHMPDSFSVIRNTATVGVGVKAKRKCYYQKTKYMANIVKHA